MCEVFFFKFTMATIRKENVVISLVFFIALKMVFNSILTPMQTSMLYNDLSILLIVFYF